MSGINSSTAPWYASRATGVVALLLLTAVMALGLLVSRQGRLPGLPRFAATGLHRNPSLTLAAVVTSLLRRRGGCTAITLDELGYPLIDPGPLAPGLERHGRRAVSACPALPLRLTRPAGRRPATVSTRHRGKHGELPS